VRFEEDNWESPTLGAWGMGWQVLLDGLEITQFTYFQQSGGIDLDPVPAELTYGLDRICAYLQGVDSVYDVRWSNDRTYGQVRLLEEQEFSAYNFEYADPVITRKLFELHEKEAGQLLDGYEKRSSKHDRRFPLLAAYDHCLKCSHLFNLLDSRGVISTTERAQLIGRIRQIACRVAVDFLAQQAESGSAAAIARGRAMKTIKAKTTADFLFEIGCEEIPAGMLPGAMKELQVILEKYLTAHNLTHGSPIEVFAAPRRLVASCANLRLKQPDETKEITGPPKSVSYDASGKPTKAAESFAQKMNLPVDELVTISTPKGDYLSAKQVILGRPATDILEEVLPRTVAEIPWPRSMYWTGATGLHFIRPIRWVVALLDGKPLRLRLGDAVAGNSSSGHRFLGKAKIPVSGVKDYLEKLQANFVLVRPEDRKKKIEGELRRLASGKGLAFTKTRTSWKW
jgi:glycyl-tRNA synthetase